MTVAAVLTSTPASAAPTSSTAPARPPSASHANVSRLPAGPGRPDGGEAGADGAEPRARPRRPRRRTRTAAARESRTTPPLPSLPAPPRTAGGPSPGVPPRRAEPSTAGRTVPREMKETSITSEVGAGRGARRPRAHGVRPLQTITRASLAEPPVQLPVGNVQRHTRAAPRCSRQSVNPPVEAPTSIAGRPASSARRLEGVGQLHPPARDVRRRR